MTKGRESFVNQKRQQECVRGRDPRVRSSPLDSLRVILWKIDRLPGNRDLDISWIQLSFCLFCFICGFNIEIAASASLADAVLQRQVIADDDACC